MIAIVTVNGERGLNIQTLTKYIQPVLLFEVLSELEIQHGGNVMDNSLFLVFAFFCIHNFNLSIILFPFPIEVFILHSCAIFLLRCTCDIFC